MHEDEKIPKLIVLLRKDGSFKAILSDENIRASIVVLAHDDMPLIGMRTKFETFEKVENFPELVKCFEVAWPDNVRKVDFGNKRLIS